MYSVYIIQSGKDNSWYYGFTTDIDKRLEFHNVGKSKYTSIRRPWQLIFLRHFEFKQEALKFEHYLKKTRNKDYIKREYSQFFLN